ncbi:hypothetical protein CK3_17710 [butyrate-producing bacterium SS3/4]|nr:hypothetical protein CK3_17710 [butyrate-producing bacterium SS3/4]
MIIKRTQQKRFPVFCLICCLTCLFCFIGSISAFALQTATPSDADKIRITKIQNEDELLALPDFTLPLKSSPSDDDMEPIYLFALKYQTVSATVIENNESRSERFSVCWDFSAIDQTTLGDYAATGRIELPEGYCFGENVLKELVISVHVEKTPPAVIISIEQWYPYTDAFALPQGSTEETLNHLLRFSPHHLECYTENKISYSALVEWDLSDIDFDTVGLYQAKGRLAAPENTEFADGIVFPEISIPVSIQAPGRPDINCVIAARGNLCFPWVTPPGDPDKINVWLSANDEPWKQLEDGVYAGKEMLSIKTYLLTSGNSYRLQVDYDGGQTGILSFTYSDELVLEGYYKGDRDGGDAKGNPPGSITQPPPEQNIDQKVEQNGDENKDENPDRENDPTDRTENASSMKPLSKAEAASDPKEPSSSEIAFTEFFDDTTDRISGTRLLMMLQTGRQKASFSKQGITIRVPRASLPKDIQNNDQIEVIIKKISDRSFSFSFCINGVSFDSLPGASVMLPYPQETAADSLYLCDESGIKIPVSDYDDAAKAASFPIDHTGTYTMAASKDPDSPAQTAKKKPDSPARTAAKDSESSATAGEKDPDSSTQTAAKDSESSATADGKNPDSPTLTAAKDSESSVTADGKNPDSPTRTAAKDSGASAPADGKEPDSPALTADAEHSRSPLLFLLPASLLLLSAGVLFLRRRWK